MIQVNEAKCKTYWMLRTFQTSCPAKNSTAQLLIHQQRQKKWCRKFGGTGNCRHVRCLRTAIIFRGKTYSNPGWRGSGSGQLIARQPQRDVIPLDHTTLWCFWCQFGELYHFSIWQNSQEKPSWQAHLGGIVMDNGILSACAGLRGLCAVR